jgi:tetratricopeptide (TPR) repeat protein
MRRATCPGPYRPGRQAELASAYGAFGLVLMATNYGDAANASLLHAQALAPDDMRWPYYLGQLHTLIGDGTRATEFFERAVDLQPTNVATLVSLGRAYLDQGRPEAAERLFDQALLLEPSSGAVLAGMGRAALAQRDYRGAAEHLERALAVEPRASSLRYPLAMAHRALGNVETPPRGTFGCVARASPRSWIR